MGKPMILYTLIVIANMTMAKHDFQSREVCLQVKRDIQRQIPDSIAICIEKART